MQNPTGCISLRFARILRKMRTKSESIPSFELMRSHLYILVKYNHGMLEDYIVSAWFYRQKPVRGFQITLFNIIYYTVRLTYLIW